MATDTKDLPNGATASAIPPLNKLMLEVIGKTLAPGLTNYELALFGYVCQRSGLDPFAKQIIAEVRNKNDSQKRRVVFITTVDGYRSQAERSGKYAGQDEPTYGPDCGCDQPPKKHPEWVSVRVYRKGQPKGVAATIYWHEFKPKPPEGLMWNPMPRHMSGLCAERQALRKGFPFVMENLNRISSEGRTALGLTSVVPDIPVVTDLSELPAPGPGGNGDAPPVDADDDQLQRVNYLNESLPREKRWAAGKVQAELESPRGANGVLVALESLHVMAHGPGCEHLKDAAAREASEQQPPPAEAPADLSQEGLFPNG